MTDTDRDNITLHIVQNSDWTLTALFKNPDGSAKDLTGKKFKMGIVTNPGTAPIVTLTTENSKIAVTTATGKVVFTLKAADTDLLKGTRFEYDVYMYDTTPNTDYLWGGVVLVRLKRTP